MKSKALRARIDLYSLKASPAAHSSTPAMRDCSGVPLLPEKGMSKRHLAAFHLWQFILEKIALPHVLHCLYFSVLLTVSMVTVLSGALCSIPLL